MPVAPAATSCVAATAVRATHRHRTGCSPACAAPGARKNAVAGKSQRSGQQGVTLVELMVALTVLAILAVAAMPNLKAIVNAGRLGAAANETVATLQTARLEAVRLNRRTVACISATPNADVPACSVAGSGWIVFQDANRDGQYAVAERLIRRATVSGSVQLRSSAAFASKVTFNSDGMARDAGGSLLNAAVSLCLPTSEPRENERDVSIRAGSRVRITRKDAAGKCLAPVDKP